MSLDWNDALSDLIILLAGLYPDRDKARLASRLAQLDPDNIDISGLPKIFWMRIVEEAHRRKKVQNLIDVAKKDFENIDFRMLEEQLQQSTKSLERKIDDNDWKASGGAPGGFEKIMAAQPTFLPIRFLQTGLLRSRAVARIKAPAGLGTGFLIGNGLLITNNHVLPNPKDAATAKIWFNYEETASNAQSEVAEFDLDPDAGFATSPIERGDDWTAVRVKGDASEWSPLELADSTVQVNDYVNIIQHPAGLPKQIALYHNVVVYADDKRVQYLTDTMPGSSGSPVFDSDWRVVAVHHQGGWLTEPGSRKVFFRNQGIHVRALLNGLRASRLSRRIRLTIAQAPTFGTW